MRLFLPLFVLALLPNPLLAQTHSLLPSPKAVEAVALGQKIIRVYWNAVPDAESYRIYRDNKLVGQAPANATQWTDNLPEPGMQVTYKVAAVDSNGDESFGAPYLERAFPPYPKSLHCDVLVVGATSAGVAAAVSAARYGLHVVLTEETRRLGGMPVNGLGSTDMRNSQDASGFFEEFRQEVEKIYGKGNGMAYEPRVAEQAMKEIIWNTPNLTVFRQVRPIKVKKVDGRITYVTMEELPSHMHSRFYAKVVIDATDCGDVAAWAGAPYALGRENRTKREPHNGFIYYDRYTDSLLPGSTGKGDKRIQAYAYLMTVKDYGPGADKTIPEPPGYDVNNYIHAVPFDKSWAVSSGVMPNHKFEINQHPQGSDLQAVNYKYPIDTYAQRRKIEELYKEHDLGYLYYIQTVEGKKNIGLSEDDYRDTDNWPPLLYIREARRIIGKQWLDEEDISDARKVIRPNAIGYGDYPMDSHACQPKLHWNRPDFGEGEFYLPQHTPWHQIPYDIMIPQKVNNLIVPMAVSSSHVAFGALRLESIRMNFGEAAGIAAWFCVHYSMEPADVPVRQIQRELLKSDAGNGMDPARAGIANPGPCRDAGYLYKFPDVTPKTDKFQDIEWLAARGFYPCPPPAKWTASTTMYAAPFHPYTALTWGEAKRLLLFLLAREAYQHGEDHTNAQIPIPAGMEDQPISRGDCAILLARTMGWKAPEGASYYEDLQPGTPVSNAAEALYATYIDSELWDYGKALAPDGKLYFRPNHTLTNAQFAQMLHFAHEYIGPLWYDYRADTITYHAPLNDPTRITPYVHGNPYEREAPLAKDLENFDSFGKGW